MPRNHCSENALEITRIEAYPLDAIKIPYGRTDRRVIEASEISLSGAPVVVSLRQESATSGSQRQEDASGPYYANSLSWQTDDTSPETLNQLTYLETHLCHYIIYMYGGARRLFYNEDGFAPALASVSMQDEESATVALAATSRMAILAIKE